MCIPSCEHRGQRPAWDVSPPLLSCLKQGLFVVHYCIFQATLGSGASSNCPDSASHLTTGTERTLGLAVLYHAQFYISSGNPNSVPYACIASNTEPAARLTPPPAYRGLLPSILLSFF